MSTLEIIHLRSSGEALESLIATIRTSIAGGGESSDTVTLFRRQGLETDLAVHIHRAGPRVGKGPSTLALQLAAALRSYGIVEHTVWEEA